MSIVKNTFILFLICGGFHGMTKYHVDPVGKVVDAFEARDAMAALRSGPGNLPTGGAGPRLEGGPVTLGNRPGDQLAFEMAFASAQTGGSSSSGLQMPHRKDVLAAAYLASFKDRLDEVVSDRGDDLKKVVREFLDTLHAQAGAVDPATSGASSSSGGIFAELIGHPLPAARSDLGLLLGFREAGVKAGVQSIVNLAALVDELSGDPEGTTLEKLGSRLSLLFVEDFSPVVGQLLDLMKRKIDEEPPIDKLTAEERFRDVLCSFLKQEVENKRKEDEHARNFPHIEKQMSQSKRYAQNRNWLAKVVANMPTGMTPTEQAEIDPILQGTGHPLEDYKALVEATMKRLLGDVPITPAVYSLIYGNGTPNGVVRSIQHIPASEIDELITWIRGFVPDDFILGTDPVNFQRRLIGLIESYRRNDGRIAEKRKRLEGDLHGHCKILGESQQGLKPGVKARDPRKILPIAKADTAWAAAKVDAVVDQAWAESAVKVDGVAARRVEVIAGHLVKAPEGLRARGSIAASLPTRKDYLENIKIIHSRLPDNKIYSFEELFSNNTPPTKEEIDNAVKKTIAERKAAAEERREEVDRMMQKQGRETPARPTSEEQRQRPNPLARYHRKELFELTGGRKGGGNFNQLAGLMRKSWHENRREMINQDSKYLESMNLAAAVYIMNEQEDRRGMNNEEINLAAAIKVMAKHILAEDTSQERLHPDYILEIIYNHSLRSFAESWRANIKRTGVVPSDEEINELVDRLLAGVPCDVSIAIPPFLEDTNLKEHMAELLFHTLRSNEPEGNEVIKRFDFLMHILSEEGNIPGIYRPHVRVVKFDGAASSSRPGVESRARMRRGFESRQQEFERMMEGQETPALVSLDVQGQLFNPSAQYDIKKLQQVMGEDFRSLSFLFDGIHKSFQRRAHYHGTKKRETMEEYCKSLTLPERTAKIFEEVLKKEGVEKDPDMLFMLYHNSFKDFLTHWSLYLTIPNGQIPPELETHVKFREFIAPYIKQKGRPSDEEIHALVDAILVGVPGDISVSIEPLLGPVILKEHMHELLFFALSVAKGKSRESTAMSHRAIRHLEFLMHMLFQPKDLGGEFQRFLTVKTNKFPKPPESAL